VRYISLHRRSEIEVREATPGFLAEDLVVKVTHEAPLLTVYNATYGPQGAGSYDAKGLLDVTEKICGW
jgi:hypothetical protein